MIYSTQLFLESILCLFLTHAVVSINIKSTPTHRNKDDEVFQHVELSNQHDFPQIHIRGYAGDDFYQKASKSIPRMGRRSEMNPKTSFCAPQDIEEIRGNEAFQELINEGLASFIPSDNVKQKRSYLVPEKISDDWPWDTDRTWKSEFKRAEVNDPCYYSSKDGRSNLKIETCNEDMICCPIPNDLPIFKRILSTRGSKQTTSAPDYKANQFK